MKSPIGQEGIERRAFDAIAQAQNVGTVEELDRVAKAFLTPLGYTVIAGVNAVDRFGRPKVDVLFGQSHAGWEAHYQAHRYARCDAVIREMLHSTEPLFWTDLPERHRLTGAEKRVLHEAGEFKLHNGFMVPLHNLDGSISAVLLMGEHLDDRDPDMRAASYVLSVYYGSIGRRLKRDAKTQRQLVKAAKSLAPRELECQNWVRAGKSSSDIGEILGISARTVDEYIGQACVRLGVRTRVQAVAEAAIHRLIEL